MFLFISVFLHYLVQILVRSAMNRYCLFIFWNILVLVFVSKLALQAAIKKRSERRKTCALAVVMRRNC